jgi:hypothetical protein
MSTGCDELAELLRWYPAAWRERYGDELVALMQDVVGDRQPSFRFKLSVAWAGLRERIYGAGLVGDQPPVEQARTGSLLVLCAWTAFVLAGMSFSKVSEHYSYALPPSLRALPQSAFKSVAGLGIIGASLVALGALATLPAFVRFIRNGGWTSIRGHVLRAAALTAITAGALVPLSLWAHHLDLRQRNGGDGLYSAAIGLWALLVAVTLAQWTASGVAAVRRIDLPRGVLRFEATLAIAVAVAMVLVTGAAGLWWGAMAHDAPWFLQGTAPGTSPSPFTLQLVMTLTLMLTAVLTAAYGVARITRSLGGLKQASM